MDAGAYIYLRWIGEARPDEGMLEAVGDHVATVFGVPAKIAVSEGGAPDTFDPARGQYSSTKTLRWVLQAVPEDAVKVVAITDGDLFIPVLTFVFGEAQLGGVGAVVSIARLRIDVDGFPSPPSRFRARLLKECVHEIGHTFGLAHCALARCAMSRSNTVLEVDAKGWELCRDCRRLLKEHQQKKQG